MFYIFFYKKTHFKYNGKIGPQLLLGEAPPRPMDLLLDGSFLIVITTVTVCLRNQNFGNICKQTKVINP